MKKIMAISLVLSILVSMSACNISRKITTVNAEALVESYKKSEFKANLIYKYRVIDIKGVIANLDVFDEFNERKTGFFVSLAKNSETNWHNGTVLCRFDQKYADEISKLKIGDSVTIRGRIASSFLLPLCLLVSDCVLVNHSPQEIATIYYGNNNKKYFDAAGLVAIYKEDINRADKAFLKQTINIYSTILSIDKDLNGIPFVTLGEKGKWSNFVMCYFDIKNRNNLSKLKIGDQIMVKGKIVDLLSLPINYGKNYSGVIVKECELIETTVIFPKP